MGFARDMAKVGTFGLAGLALGGKKKGRPAPPVPTMISSTAAPTSMIGGTRGY